LACTAAVVAAAEYTIDMAMVYGQAEGHEQDPVKEYIAVGDHTPAAAAAEDRTIGAAVAAAAGTHTAPGPAVVAAIPLESEAEVIPVFEHVEEAAAAKEQHQIAAAAMPEAAVYFL
jgi:hypothetical protein